MLTNNDAKAQQSMTGLLRSSAGAGAAMRRVAGAGEGLARPSGRALSDVERALLDLSIEPLYRESEDGTDEKAEVSRRFLASLMGRAGRHPFELRDLRGLDARLMQHAASVLRLGRGIECSTYIRECDKESISHGCVVLERELP